MIHTVYAHAPTFKIHSKTYQILLQTSGVGSSHALRGPQIQVVGMALIIEFCDHNIPLLKVVF